MDRTKTSPEQDSCQAGTQLESCSGQKPFFRMSVSNFLTYTCNIPGQLIILGLESIAMEGGNWEQEGLIRKADMHRVLLIIIMPLTFLFLLHPSVLHFKVLKKRMTISEDFSIGRLIDGMHAQAYFLSRSAKKL